MLCAEFGWNWLSGSGGGDKKKQTVYHNNNNDDDDDGQRTNCDQKSSLEPSAQVSQKAKAKSRVV